MSTIQIYIADLAAYNNGKLYGKWIDATQDVTDIQDEINQLLKSSPQPDAEEYAIHDYEGFEGMSLHEYEGIQSAHDKAQFIEKHGKLGAAIVSYFGGDLEDAKRALEDCYIGEYESAADYAQEITEECTEIPEHLQYYIAYDAMARDMLLNGEIIDIELGYEEHHLFHHI